MKILITGAKGMLGRELSRVLADHDIMATDLDELNISNQDEVHRVCKEFKPAVIIHSAAYTNVDGCETNADLAFEVNAAGSGNVARAASDVGARLIAISTDYVFSGELDQAYSESDAPSPQTVYGASKLAGEQIIAEECENHLILRTAWLYGPGGPSFVHAIISLLQQGWDPLKVVDDQKGNPTSSAALCNAISTLLTSDITGVAHATCSGDATWFEFANEIKTIIEAERPTVPCTTDEFPRPAKRPRNSRLENTVLEKNGIKMPHWRKALREFMSTNPNG